MVRNAMLLICLVAFCVSLLGCPGLSAPNVVGLTQASAISVLLDFNLTVGTVTTATSATVPTGTVISQDPGAGTGVLEGDPINLVVSLGASIAVPNVVGLSQAAATSALEALGLTVGTVTTATSDTVPEGQIISQNPSAGTSVSAGTAVSFVVSLGTPSLSPALGWSYVPSVSTVWGLALDPTTDGGLIMAGGHNSRYDLYALKLTANGTEDWDDIYTHMSGDATPSNCWAYPARAIKQMQDGGYIMLGAGHKWINGQSDGLDGISFLLVKTDSSGNEVWSKAYAPDNPYSVGNKCIINYAYAMQVTSDGGFMAAGNSYVGAHHLATILKTDSAGNLEFIKVINDNNREYTQEIRSAQQTSDGGYILCGYTSDAPSGDMALLIKLNSAGNLEWANNYQDVADGYGAAAYTVTQAADGTYLLGGDLLNSIITVTKGQENSKTLGHGGFLAKVDSDGDLIWLKKYDKRTYTLEETPQGDIVVGSAYNAGEMMLAKFDSNGDWLWNYVLDTLPHANPNDIELTTDGGCMMVGSGISSGTVIAKINNVFQPVPGK